MEYVRLYTALLTHPKWLALSDAAKALLVQAWIYAGAQETDGYVHEEACKVIRVRPKVADELEAAGWWTRNGAGWDLNDWDEHQESAREIKRRRQKNRERQAAFRRRQREDA